MKKITFFFLIIIFILLISCTKKATSPEEINLVPPDNFQIEVIDFTSVKLSWQDVSENKEGYLIYKMSFGVIQDSIYLPENSVEFIDEEIIPGLNYNYIIQSFWENEFSSHRYKSINTFPVQISNLNISIIDSTTTLLTWNDNCDFEDGYKIDKSFGWNNWDNETAILQPNTTEWIDDSSETDSLLYYRVYAFYNGINSSKKGNDNGCNYFLPIELTSLNIGLYEIVSINWVTECEYNVLGWNLYRVDYWSNIWNDEIPKVNLELITGLGSISEPAEYSIQDDNEINDLMFSNYLLECVTLSGYKCLISIVYPPIQK